MDIAKPSDADKAYFMSLVPDARGVETKPMFGNLAAFINGTMFMGLFGPAIGVRLAPDDRTELLAVEGAGPFGPIGRPMKEYVAMPAAWRDHPSSTEPWVARALAHAATLPPKKKR